jgi:hypothetical protein
LRRRRGSRATRSTDSDAGQLLLLHLLLLFGDQRRVLGRDNLTDLVFQLRRPPFQLIGIAVPRALSL